MLKRLLPRWVRLSLLLLVLAFLFGVTRWERQRMAASAIAPSAQRTSSPRVDATRMVADVKQLSSAEFAGRETGTEGSARARRFILERFTRLRLERLGPSYEQPFAFTRHSIRGLISPTGRFTQEFPEATNLVALRRGTAEPDRYVLLTAHYDHLGVRGGETYHGADDNASGVAGMLEAAAWFSQHPPGRSIVFVAFDAEEQGLRGAKHFVDHPPIDLKRIELVVNLDMIGRGDENTVVVAGTHHYPHLKPAVVEAARGRGIGVVFGHDRPFVQAARVEDWTHSSDHGPFHDAGVPFLYFGVEDHADYHKPGDTAEKIPVPFFTEVVELVIDTVGRFVAKG